MPLKEVDLTIRDVELPAEIRRFLREADERIDAFNRAHGASASGFIPSNYVTVYRALRAIVEANLPTCRSFCEWGSGFGIVASLACMLEFNACGIEVNPALVEVAQRLADDFDLPVEFIQGSFVPPGGESIAEEAFAIDTGEMFWLETHTDDSYDRLGLETDDFAVIFAYPWPGEHGVIERLFDRFAAVGALLLTYDHADSIRLQRKLSRAMTR